MNERLKYLNIAFTVIFLKYALKIVGDLEFFIYNFFYIQIDFLYLIIDIALALLVIVGVYRMYRYSVQMNSFIFAAGNLLLSIYYFFFSKYMTTFLIDRNSDFFFENSSALELNVAHYFDQGFVMIMNLIIIVIIIKNRKNTGRKADTETLDSSLN